MKNEGQKISHRVIYCHAAIAFLLTAGIAWTAPLDVTVGSFLGGLAGCLLLMTGLFDDVLPAKTLEEQGKRLIR